MITVLRLPSFGSSSTLPVRKVTPNTPANHIHHGPFAAVAGISGYGPSSSVKVSIAMRPTLNDTSEARNGEPMERPSRVFTAVCTGVISPEKIPSNPCSMFSFLRFSAHASRHRLSQHQTISRRNNKPLKSNDSKGFHAIPAKGANRRP